MILLVSNASDLTADFLQARLARSGATFARLNTERLADYPMKYAVRQGQVRGWIEVEGERIALDDLASVYYRRPRAPVPASISEPALAQWVGSEVSRAWSGILSVLPLVWVNHPSAISGAAHKPEQLARASRLGLSVPESLITSDPEEARAFCDGRCWDVVAKPVGHGYLRGSTEADDRLIYTSALSPVHASTLERVRGCPTYFQRRLARDTDVRVTVVGEKCFAADLRLPNAQATTLVDCRRDNMRDVNYGIRQLPAGLEERLVGLVRSYGLVFAAIDLILDLQGAFWFLELNPAGQWAWIEEQTSLPIAEALTRELQRPLAGREGLHTHAMG